MTKKAILLTSMFFSCSLAFAVHPEGVLSLKFGDNKQKVHYEMTNQYRFKDEEKSNSTTFVYRGGSFGGQKINFVAFNFYKDAMMRVHIGLDCEDKDVVEALKNGITEKYGKEPDYTGESSFLWQYGEKSNVALMFGVITSLSYCSDSIQNLQKRDKVNSVVKDL